MGSNRPPSDDSIERALAQRRPVTLPVQAYGGRVEWAKRPLPVWAWVQWTDGPAERIEAAAYGWTDRVVLIEFTREPGGTHQIVVWRNAVTKRAPGRGTPAATQ